MKPILLLCIFFTLFYSLPIYANDINLDNSIDITDAIIALQVASGLNPNLSIPQGINWKGTWMIGWHYKEYDAVTHDGSSYICILQHESTHNRKPPNNAIWDILSIKGSENNLFDINGNDIVYSKGNLGIKSSTPHATLDVGGGIRVGYTAECNEDKRGVIRYVSEEYRMQFCDGSSWIDMGVGNAPTTIAEGESYGGGIIFKTDGSHGLIAASADHYSEGMEWGCNNYKTYVRDKDNGKENTSLLTNLSCEATAAQICADLELNGYNDWFLPAYNQLIELYNKRNIVGGFRSGAYWSSTEQEYNGTMSYAVEFVNGGFKGDMNKTWEYFVRCIREF